MILFNELIGQLSQLNVISQPREGEDVIIPASKSSSGKKKKPRSRQEGNDLLYQKQRNGEVQEAAVKEGKRTRRPRRGNEKRGQEAGPAGARQATA